MKRKQENEVDNDKTKINTRRKHRKEPVKLKGC